MKDFKLGDKVITEVKDLTGIGIDRDLSGLVGEITGFYSSGWVEVEYEPDIETWGKYALSEKYDIRTFHLKKIN